MWGTVVVSAIVGLSTVAVALGGHLIGARSALNNKKIEVLFARKADAYKTVLETAGEFAASLKTLRNIIPFKAPCMLR
jgi:hypothetical protein